MRSYFLSSRNPDNSAMITLPIGRPFISLIEGSGKGISLVGVPKKVVPLSKSAHVSVSSEFILQIKLILSSPNVVLTFYTYKVSNKKVSS
jgi:hypothetical protein